MTSAASLDLGQLYRQESGRILSTLIRVLGDFGAAQEVVQESFAAALDRWPVEGTPQNPQAWLFRVARNKAVDALRRKVRSREKQEALLQDLADAGATTVPGADAGEGGV